MKLPKEFADVWVSVLWKTLGVGVFHAIGTGFWWLIPAWPALMFLLMFVAMGTTHWMEREQLNGESPAPDRQ